MQPLWPGITEELPAATKLSASIVKAWEGQQILAVDCVLRCDSLVGVSKLDSDCWLSLLGTVTGRTVVLDLPVASPADRLVCQPDTTARQHQGICCDH